MIRTTALLLLVSAVALLLPGCATSSNQDEVSSIPWNRPERWEGQGPMGGMMNTY
ncbi:MAG TPA: hypothetical protein VNQ90_17125 [Chthoniobacteraceae bacterium]|nr:hypothetical protein [Chthoniobacteraceae bacterium]